MQVLVIARLVPDTPIEQMLPLVKPEAAKIWEYYVTEIVRSVYYLADKSGAVLLLEVPNLEAANEAIAQLPMAQANTIKFEVLPLKPFTGIAELFA